MKKKNRINKSNGNQDVNARIGFMMIPALTLKDFISINFEDKGENKIELSIGLSDSKLITICFKLNKTSYIDFKQLNDEKKQSIYDSLRESIYFDLNLIGFWKLKEYDVQKTLEYINCNNAITRIIKLFGNLWKTHIEYLIYAVK